jgi:ATP-binding cassette, subfamily C, bacterial CydD
VRLTGITARQLRFGSRDVIWPIAFGMGATIALVAQIALFSRLVGNVFIRHQTFTASLPLYAGLACVLVWRALFAAAREAAAGQAAIRVKARLRRRLLHHLLALGPMFTRGERSGELAATATEGVERLDAYVGKYLPQRAFGVLVPLTIALAVCTQDWISAALLLVTAPIIPVLMMLVGSFAEGQVQAQWLALGRLSAHFLDMLHGLPTLKAFGRGDSARATVARVSEDYRDRTIKVMRYAFLSGLVLEFITAGAIALVAVELGVRLIAGSVSFERALFVLLLTPEFFRPLRELGQHRHAAMEGAASGKRIAEILATPEYTPVRSLPSAGMRVAITAPSISFERVSYTYPGAARNAVTNVSLLLRGGTRTALVGRSGSGKSTLLNLLMGFLEPDDGLITAGETSIAVIGVPAWRANFALVPQRPHLFHATIRENIALGRADATQDEVEWAAELAGAAEFIHRLPEKYAATIGDGGLPLSGGEAQRIAIARAFLKDAPVLLLDEPSSNLDAASEVLVRESVRRLAHGRTVVTVAHRLNTVYTADNIAVMAAGTIVEQGRHDDLLARNGHYAALLRAGRGAPI